MAFTVCVLSASKRRDQYIANYLSYEVGRIPITGYNVLSDFNVKLNSIPTREQDLDYERSRVIAWFVNNYTRPLSWVLDEDAMVEFIQTNSPSGLRIYQKSLDFLFVIACERVFSSLPRKAILRHSIADSHYWEFEDGPVTQEDVDNIHAEMRKLVEKNLPITREMLTIDKAKRLFQRQGEPEIAELFIRANLDPVEVYRCGKHYCYTCGIPLAPSTGMLKTFDLTPFAHGMMLRFPTTENPEGIPPFDVPPSIGDVFFDYGAEAACLYNERKTMERSHDKGALVGKGA